MRSFVSELVRLAVVCSLRSTVRSTVMISSAQKWYLPPNMDHGGVQMGVPNDNCDNAQWKLSVDWDDSSDFEYTCQPQEDRIPVALTYPLESCLPNEMIPRAIHKCMTESITYNDEPPRGGPHRPLWPVYGEYLYIPPQRWVHSLEHGGLAFLYHPCADPGQIRSLKAVAKACLRRHIITPYRKLPRNQPLAILSYGCKMTMSHVNYTTVRMFIKENARNARRASEADVWKDGQYSYKLIAPATVVPGSNNLDSFLCPLKNMNM